MQLGQHGEAARIFDQEMKPEIDQGLIFFISNLAKDLGRLKEIIPIFEKVCQNNASGLTDLFQFQLQCHNFQEAAQIALKLYKSNLQTQSYLFEYILLLSQSNDMGGKIIEVLWLKLDQGPQLWKFQMKYYQHHKNSAKVLQLLTEHANTFKEHQTDCNIALWLYQQESTQANYELVLKYYLKIYQSHQDEPNFIMNFEKQYALIEVFYNKDIQLKQIDVLTLFSVQTQKEELINHIYSSCYKALESVKAPLIRKSIILTILKIQNLAQHQIDLTLIEGFYQIQGDKYSFCSELFNAVKDSDQSQIYKTLSELKIQFKTQESEIIKDINLKKIQVALSENPESYLEELLQLYHKYPVQENLEKGERLVQDDYLMMAVDVLFDLNSLEKTIKALALTDQGLIKSPYNYELQMRQIVLYCSIGLVDVAIEKLTVLDVKGVQFDTLGFTYARAYLEFASGAFVDQVEKKNIQALAFYLENTRESKKNLITTLKQTNYEPFNSFYQFENWISSSYVKQIYELVQSRLIFSKSGNPVNNEWFNNQIRQSLKKPQTYSISQSLFQTFQVRDFNRGLAHRDYLGIYENPQYLVQDTNAIEIQQLLQQASQDQKVIPQIEELLHYKVDKQEFKYRNQLQHTQYVTYAHLTEYQIFADKEFQVRSQLINQYIKLLNVISNSDLNQIIFSTEGVSEIIALIKQNITNTLNVQLFRYVNRFYVYLVPILTIMLNQQAELKQRLQKLSKKAPDQNGFNKLSKQLLASIESLKEPVLQLSFELIKHFKNLDYSEFVQLLINGAFANDLSELLRFLNIQYKSIIEEKIKLLK